MNSNNTSGGDGLLDLAGVVALQAGNGGRARAGRRGPAGRRARHPMNSNNTSGGDVLLDLAGVVALQAGNAVLSYRGLIGALMGLAAVGIFSWLLQRHLTARFRAAALAIAEQGELLRTTLASIGDGGIPA